MGSGGSWNPRSLFRGKGARCARPLDASADLPPRRRWERSDVAVPPCLSAQGLGCRRSRRKRGRACVMRTECGALAHSTRLRAPSSGKQTSDNSLHFASTFPSADRTTGNTGRQTAIEATGPQACGLQRLILPARPRVPPSQFSTAARCPLDGVFDTFPRPSHAEYSGYFNDMDDAPESEYGEYENGGYFPRQLPQSRQYINDGERPPRLTGCAGECRLPSAAAFTAEPRARMALTGPLPLLRAGREGATRRRRRGRSARRRRCGRTGRGSAPGMGTRQRRRAQVPPAGGRACSTCGGRPSEGTRRTAGDRARGRKLVRNRGA